MDGWGDLRGVGPADAGLVGLHRARTPRGTRLSRCTPGLAAAYWLPKATETPNRPPHDGSFDVVGSSTVSCSAKATAPFRHAPTRPWGPPGAQSLCSRRIAGSHISSSSETIGPENWLSRRRFVEQGADLVNYATSSRCSSCRLWSAFRVSPAVGL
jgi:hypothetical protein